MFEIGDKVRVVDACQKYSLYPDWADVHGLDKYNYQDVEGIDMTLDFTVIARGFHGSGSGVIIYGITDGERDYIIGEDGLKLAPEPMQYEWLWYGYRKESGLWETDQYLTTKDAALNYLNSGMKIKFKKKHIHKVKGSKRKVEGK